VKPGITQWVRRAAAAAAALVALALPAAGPAAPPAAAHVRSSEGTSLIRQEGSGVRYDLSLEYDVLRAAVGLGRPPEADAAAAGAMAEPAARGRLAAYLIGRVVVSHDGAECAGRLAGTGVERRDGVPYARVLLLYECPGSRSGGAYTVGYGVFADGAVVDDHRNIADYRLGAASGTFIFDAGHHELVAGRAGAQWATAARFVMMGVQHILSGLDHLLFLGALLIGAAGLRSLGMLVSAFTIAHSVTLGFGALGWVHISPQIVEPLIALSIAYVAAENIIGGETRHRPLIVFGFGLLHGLGFAETLGFAGEFGGRLLVSLLSFNLGIELGQTLLVGSLFPLLIVLRRRLRWSAAVQTGGAAAAGTLGLLWFFQRLVI
jgi:hypothetical protein